MGPLLIVSQYYSFFLNEIPLNAVPPLPPTNLGSSLSQVCHVTAAIINDSLHLPCTLCCFLVT